MRILHVVGARPNFMKAAPVIHALSEYRGIQQVLVHTGQHYDFNMSDVFFQELGLPAANINLQVGSGSHAQQTAEIMSRFEPAVLEYKPELVLVYGDVNSTVAAALVCSKLQIAVAHVEAGLRSFDRSMPEEINRLLTDQISELLFTPSLEANENLIREGIAPEKIHFVGNVMIDTLVRMLPKAGNYLPRETPEAGYVLVTLHRPSNVDDLDWLMSMLKTLERISEKTPILFPIHPRTRQRLTQLALEGADHGRVIFLEAQPYLAFLALQTQAAVVITDSGGVQEETTFLGIPCLTVRERTERPVTVQTGTNIVVGRDLVRLQAEVEAILSDKKRKTGRVPPLWDGHSGQRIAEVLAKLQISESGTVHVPKANIGTT